MQLVEATIASLEDQQPWENEHHGWESASHCYLFLGNTEKFLQALELRLDHHHFLNPWFLAHPIYDSIRMEPRFIAVIEEADRRFEEQRTAVATMMAEAEL